jgi:hypothetical protein
MLRKIADIPRPCTNPGHYPPNMIVLPPGVYEHVCPGCGQKMTFTVPHGPQVTCMDATKNIAPSSIVHPQQISGTL